MNEEITLSHAQKVALLKAVESGKINLQNVFGTQADNSICESCEYRPHSMTQEEAQEYLRRLEECY